VNDGKRLVAEVRDADGNWNETWVSLNKKITNDNGVLRMLWLTAIDDNISLSISYTQSILIHSDSFRGSNSVFTGRSR